MISLFIGTKAFKSFGVELGENGGRVVEELAVIPEVATNSPFTVLPYRWFTIYVGDFFALETQQLAAVAAIYDRAALVALPRDMRISTQRICVRFAEMRRSFS